jgi:hypothetical protein
MPGVVGGGPLDDAITALDDIPMELDDHPAMEGVKIKVVQVLAQKIEELHKIRGTAEGDARIEEKARKKAKLQQAGDALAKALGPVREMFEHLSTDRVLADGGIRQKYIMRLKVHVGSLNGAAVRVDG